jgi:hypothetical protein
MSTGTTTISTQPPPQEKKKGIFGNLGKHASNAFSGLFGNNKTDPNTPTPTPTTAAGLTGGKSRRRRKSRSRRGGNPKKGMASKSRKGRKDFVTHKGDKYYNRKGHRQSRNAKGKRKSPYRKH